MEELQHRGNEKKSREEKYGGAQNIYVRENVVYENCSFAIAATQARSSGKALSTTHCLSRTLSV